MSFLVTSSRTGSKGVQHCFQPIYYVSRCAGLWPFTIIYHSNGSIEELRVRLIDIFWSSIMICSCLAGLFYAYNDTRNVQFGASIMYFIVHVPPLLFGPVSIILDMFNRKKLVNILDKFITFDSEVGVLKFNKRLGMLVVQGSSLILNYFYFGKCRY